VSERVYTLQPMMIGDLLVAELAERRARNARYSLRAFARDLRTDHATVSQWLRGQRQLSRRRLCAIGKRIGLSSETIERCCVERCERAVLDAIRLHPTCVGSRRLARRLGAKMDEINIALHRLLMTRRLQMPTRHHWIVAEKVDA
jgi:transcriptional regulator with XRE-family HTH domain